MIQRIQSVFLLLVILGMTAFLFLPFWEKTDPETGNLILFTPFLLKQIIASNSETTVVYYPYIFCGIGAIISILVAGIEIMNYNNRMTQIKFGLINSILMSLVLFFSAWLSLKAQQNYFPSIKGAYKLGLFAPVFSMIFNSLANRFIKKDEDKVRSADRIR